MRERRILITNDRDFGELVVRGRLEHAGVVLLRLETTDLATKIARLDYVLEHHRGDLGGFLVVTERLVRVR